MSEVILTNIQLWRQKAQAGTMTLEETREAINAIRGSRLAAGQQSTESKVRKSAAKAKAAPIDAQSLLDELL